MNLSENGLRIPLSNLGLGQFAVFGFRAIEINRPSVLFLSALVFVICLLGSNAILED